MAVASIIVGAAGFVLSYILFFPLSMLVGPFIGIAMGIVSLVLGAVARKKKPSKAATAGLIIGTIVTGVSLLRIVSLVSCVSCIAGLVSGNS